MIDSNIKNTFLDAILSMDKNECQKIINSFYKKYEDFLYFEELIVSTLKEIGDGWEIGNYSLAQVYMSGSICKELAIELIAKHPRKLKNKPRIGIGVLRDFHSLGKKIVASVILSSGYEIIDLGSGLSEDEFARKAIAENLDILLISTLMLPSALRIKKL